MTQEEAEKIIAMTMDDLITKGIKDASKLAEAAEGEIKVNHPEVLKALAIAGLEQEITEALEEQVALGKLRRGPNQTYYRA
jgi:hypothetical protein